MLGSMIVMLLAGLLDMQPFAVMVPLVLLVLWAEGDWRTPQERLEAARVKARRF